MGKTHAMARTPSMSSLRLFLQVAHSLSFSDTARTAHISQPALSRTIKLLEEDLGVRLFDRNSRNVNLTAAGAALLPTVERLTAEFDMAFRELGETFQGQRGRVVVGALPSVAADLLPKAIARFQESRPQVEIVIRENLTGSLGQNLQDRLIDFAVTTPPADGEGTRFQPLFDDDYVLVGRPEDLAGIANPAPWRTFVDLPFIAMESRSSVRMLTDVAFSNAGIAPKTRYECAQLATVGALIAQGLGISLLPRSTLRLLGMTGQLDWRMPEPPRVSRQIGLCWLKDRTLAPVAQDFLELVAEQNIDPEN